MPIAIDADLELEGFLRQQVPQSTTTADLQLYFNLIQKFINAWTMPRAKNQDSIKEDINHFLDELWGLALEYMTYNGSLEKPIWECMIFFSYPKRSYMSFRARLRMAMLRMWRQ